MIVETPQILWNSEGDRRLNAALMSISMIPSGGGGGGSRSSSSTVSSGTRGGCDGIGQQQQGEATTTTTTMMDSGCCTTTTTTIRTNQQQQQQHVVATAGVTNLINLWKITFPATIYPPTSQENGDCNHTSMTVDNNNINNNNGTCRSSSHGSGIFQKHSTTTVGATTTTSTSKGHGGMGDHQHNNNSSNNNSSNITYICSLTRHDGPVNAVSFSPNGLHLLTAGENGALIIWSAPHRHGNHDQKHEQQQQKQHPTPISKNNQHTISSSSDGGSMEFELLDERNEPLEHQEKEAEEDDNNKCVCDYWSDCVHSQNDLICRFATNMIGGSQQINDVSWSADSKRFMAGTIDHTVLVCENINHQHAASCAGAGTASKAVVDPVWKVVHRITDAHTSIVQGVAYDPLGVYMASIANDRTTRIFTRRNKKLPTSNNSKKGTNTSGTAGIEAGASKCNSPLVPITATTNLTCSSSNPQQDIPGTPSHQQQQQRAGKQQQQQQQVLSDWLTDSKLELMPKSKLIKYRCTNSTTTAIPTAAAATTTEASSTWTPKMNLDNGMVEYDDDDDDVEDSDHNMMATSTSEATKTLSSSSSATTTTTKIRRRYLFAGENVQKSFFRRLSWTADGAYLIVPSAMWHLEQQQQQPQQHSLQTTNTTTSTANSSSSSLATLLFARHRFDEPCKVLVGIEKPSIAVRANPVLFALPQALVDEHKENDSPVGRHQHIRITRHEDHSTPATASSPPPPLAGNSNNNNSTNRSGGANAGSGSGAVENTRRLPPYRSIFAVLTWNSVIIYDTYHDHPLSIIKGLHCTNMVDATWSNDGHHLVVCSTDGYVSIISFSKGELGEVYQDPTKTKTTRRKQDGSVVRAPPGQQQQQRRRIPTSKSSPQVLLPPCDPGQVAILEARPRKRVKRTTATTTPITTTQTLSSVSPSSSANKRPITAVVADDVNAVEDEDDGTAVVGDGVDRLSLHTTKTLTPQTTTRDKALLSSASSPQINEDNIADKPVVGTTTTAATTTIPVRINHLVPKRKKKRIQPTPLNTSTLS